jgi:nucleoside-diphosphate-sugar epimerase
MGRMKIVIAGGHGQIALLATARLAAAGHEVVGLVRNPEHEADLQAAGGQALVLDLETARTEEVAAALQETDAVVFAAGAGPGSGAQRKDSVDRAASVLLADAAEATGVKRFVQISAIGLERVRGGARPEGIDDVFHAYLVAKLAAEDDLRTRDGLDWTILRPGMLTDDPATGRVQLRESVAYGEISRADVADVLARLLITGAGRHRALELVAGEETVEAAVARYS